MDAYISFLTEIRETFDDSYCAYWVGPNVVLTLSGQRAYCDSVFWSSDKKQHEKWVNDLEESLEILNKHIPLLIRIARTEASENSGTYTGIDIVTKQGFGSIKSSKLIKSVSSFNGSNQEYEELFNLVVDGLNDQIKAEFSQENQKHIAQGILLGYPDVAVIGMAEIWRDEDSGKKVTEKYARAAVEAADYYMCPQPVYDYPESLSGSIDILLHEKRWSKILKNFYNSDFHKELVKNNDFQRKIQELSN